MIGELWVYVDRTTKESSYSSNNRCNLNVHTAYTHVELDHLTSWLSTLGGGYSALGDSMNKCVSGGSNTIDVASCC